VHNFDTWFWKTAVRWRLPGKKSVWTQEKSDFAIVLWFFKRKYRSCAQTQFLVSSTFWYWAPITYSKFTRKINFLALGVYTVLSRTSKRVPQIVTATEIEWGNRVFKISRRLIAQKFKILNPTLNRLCGSNTHVPISDDTRSRLTPDVISRPTADLVCTCSKISPRRDSSSVRSLSAEPKKLLLLRWFTGRLSNLNTGRWWTPPVYDFDYFLRLAKLWYFASCKFGRKRNTCFMTTRSRI